MCFGLSSIYFQVPASDHAPAFQIPAVDGFKPLDYCTLQATIRIFASRVGLQASDFSYHSLRRGGMHVFSPAGSVY